MGTLTTAAGQTLRMDRMIKHALDEPVFNPDGTITFLYTEDGETVKLRVESVQPVYDPGLNLPH